MANGYLIPVGVHRIELMVSNSRFIAHAAPAPTAADAKAFLASIRAQMPDASHHVHAFRAGYGNSVTEGMSDDGEPSGTAGPPVLAVVRGADIGDIVVVVTRYFGGTLLGTGGLVRAYGDSAREVLATLPTIRKIERHLWGIELPYHFYQPIKKLIDQHEGIIDEETFAGDVSIFVTLPVHREADFVAAVIETSNGVVRPVLFS
ncbi:MAG: YigZ family protein [Chloroflexota bacterium]|nr:YigZ family protein [Chloroflexota bacterium]